MTTRKAMQWGLSFGAIGGMLVAGLLAATLSRPASASDTNVGETHGQALAQSDTPTPTTAGADLARGRQVYDRACGRCHPGGEEDVGPRLLNKNFDWARMQKQIREGTGRMRPINVTKLPDANLPALQAYLRSIHAVR